MLPDGHAAIHDLVFGSNNFNDPAALQFRHAPVGSADRHRVPQFAWHAI